LDAIIKCLEDSENDCFEMEYLYHQIYEIMREESGYTLKYGDIDPKLSTPYGNFIFLKKINQFY